MKPAKKIIVDLGGAASPVMLAKKRKAMNVIVDKLEGYNRDIFVDNITRAVHEKGAQLIRHELKEGASLPFKEECVDHVDCREVYEGGVIIDPKLVARESRRVLKPGGTVTMSGRLNDRENVISSFKEHGFKIDKQLKKPQTWFEKRDSKAIMETIPGRMEAAEERISDPKTSENFREFYRKELERLRKTAPDLFMIRFKKKA